MAEERTTPLRSLVTVVLHSDGYVEVWGDRESTSARMVLLWPGDDTPRKIKGKLLANGMRQTGDKGKVLGRVNAIKIIKNVTEAVGPLSLDAWQCILDMARVTGSEVESIVEVLYQEKCDK